MRTLNCFPSLTSAWHMTHSCASQEGLRRPSTECAKLRPFPLQLCGLERASEAEHSRPHPLHLQQCGVERAAEAERQMHKAPTPFLHGHVGWKGLEALFPPPNSSKFQVGAWGSPAPATPQRFIKYTPLLSECLSSYS